MVYDPLKDGGVPASRSPGTPPRAQSWELEPEGDDFDPIDGFYKLMTYRTLCRQPVGWVLRKRTVHTESGLTIDGDVNTVIPKAEAKRLLLQTDWLLPDELVALPEATEDQASLPSPRQSPAPPGAEAKPDIPLVVEAPAAAGQPDEEPPQLKLVPGGFSYGRHTVKLPGKPRQVLRVLLESQCRQATAAQLLEKVWDKDSPATARNVITAVSTLRQALRKLLAKAGCPCEDPLPRLDTGRDLAWELRIPEITVEEIDSLFTGFDLE
jgi:hypothetical protein